MNRIEHITYMYSSITTELTDLCNRYMFIKIAKETWGDGFVGESVCCRVSNEGLSSILQDPYQKY